MSVITLTTPQDVIAAVPYLLGYRPSDSLVVIAATARRAVVVLRYDLPDPACDRDLNLDLADHLTATLARHKADEVALVGYGTAGLARPVLVAVIARLSDLLTIREALLVTGTRFWSLTSQERCPPDGIEIDSPATVPAAQLTAAGLAAYASRDVMLAATAPPGRRRHATPHPARHCRPRLRPRAAGQLAVPAGCSRSPGSTGRPGTSCTGRARPALTTHPQHLPRPRPGRLGARRSPRPWARAAHPAPQVPAGTPLPAPMAGACPNRSRSRAHGPAIPFRRYQ